eukprot:TRINITY_DN64586_c0_g1_i1.p2 TRINITY_DN64586_c0_g1~~TRINITY_DN64586_c0_g1_i1.p2  ORF type:complete len:117 (+),score=22.75 TRINITY_DN64586_c0_g1_i1:81-431(+)
MTNQQQVITCPFIGQQQQLVKTMTERKEKPSLHEKLPTHTSPKQAVLGEALANQPPHGKAHHKMEFYLEKSKSEVESDLKKVHELAKEKESPEGEMKEPPKKEPAEGHQQHKSFKL